MTQQISTALSNLQTFRNNHSELEYAILILQIELSRIGQEIEDHDLHSLEMMAMALDDTIDVQNLIMVTKLYLYLRNLKKLMEYMDRFEHIVGWTPQESLEFATIKIWVDCLFYQQMEDMKSNSLGISRKRKKCIDRLKSEIRMRSVRNLDGILAVAKNCERYDKIENALEHLNIAISLCPTFLPSLIEKCKLLLMDIDSKLDNLEVLRTCLLVETVSEGYSVNF